MKFHNVLETLSQDLRTPSGATLMLAVSLAIASVPASAHTNNLSAEAKIYNASGNQVGKARFSQEGDSTVVVQVHVHDLPPGFHGFHIHAVGDCTPPFTSAGGHFDLDQHTHRHHNGDLPVLLVNTDGTANAKFDSDRFDVTDLFDANGSAIIIHANPDNYANIPTRYVAEPDATTLATGDSGERIACGVIEKTVER